jgi:hypothetical protein
MNFHPTLILSLGKSTEKINKIKEPLKGLQPNLSFNKIFINSKGRQIEGTSLLKILNPIITQLSAITCSSDPADIVVNFLRAFFSQASNFLKVSQDNDNGFGKTSLSNF